MKRTKSTSLITSSRQTGTEGLFVLSQTRKLTRKDLYHPEWKMLASEYREHKDSPWVERALITLINAIYNQRRKYFLMPRRSTRKLLQSDMNWKPRIGLKNENFKKLIKAAVLRNI